ncbi:MAG: phage tail tube protein [Clostridiales bacterium]|nr:phage tail tube protein [Clostridiales bacterium]
MAENTKPLSLKEGHVYIDGVEVIDAAKLSIVYTPTVWSGKILGDKGTNRRWLGRDITGTIDEYRTTPRWINIVKQYESDGITPELTIQGIRTDKDSDYYETSGSESVTLTGVVLTGDINLISLDTDGDVVKDSIAFGAKNLTA